MNIIKNTLLLFILFTSYQGLAAPTSSSHITWIAASVKMGKESDRPPNGFYSWDGSSGSAWNAVLGISARYLSYGLDDKGKGVWVAAADTNSPYVIRYSTDGVNWHDTTFTGGIPLVSRVKYGYDLNNRGIWVAIGMGDIFYSYDGRIFNKANSRGNPEYQDVSYGNHKWIAVGYEGALHTSYDGINWEDHSFSQDQSYFSIGFGRFGDKSGWIMTGDKYLWSTDGTNWQPITDPTFTFWYWNDIKYANGLWMAASDAGIASSKDGLHWQFENIPAHDAGFGIEHGKDSKGHAIWAAFASNHMFVLNEGTSNWQEIHFKSMTECANNFVYFSSNEAPERR